MVFGLYMTLPGAGGGGDMCASEVGLLRSNELKGRGIRIFGNLEHV